MILLPIVNIGHFHDFAALDIYWIGLLIYVTFMVVVIAITLRNLLFIKGGMQDGCGILLGHADKRVVNIFFLFHVVDNVVICHKDTSNYPLLVLNVMLKQWNVTPIRITV